MNELYSRTSLPWALAAGALGLIALLVFAALRPPAPLESEERVLGVARHLTERIGHRVAGTRGAERAAAYLIEELEKIPGLEVQRHQSTGESVYGNQLTVYRIDNVIARLPGKNRDAILFAAHYDSLPESVGAADNAVSVAALLETARTLAARAPLENSLIFLLNGGEEIGLLGADAFLEHPLARDVRAFINLEAAGSAGRPILFQCGPGNRWLAEAYAELAPEPFGTIVGQDLFEAGLISSDTDGSVFRTRWPGLDVALFEEGYFYDTPRDVVANLEPGSAQAMVELAQALAIGLAEKPLPEARADEGPPIYFDLLARTMIVLSREQAIAFAILLAMATLVSIAAGVRQKRLALGPIAASTVLSLVGLALGIGAAVVLGLWMAALPEAAHGWFGRPWLALPAFGGATALGLFAPHALALRLRAGRPSALDAVTILAGVGMVWSMLALALALAGVGSGYLALIWSGASALSLGAAVLRPRISLVVAAVAWALAAIPTVEFGTAVLKLFVPMAGRMDPSLLLDPVIAVVVALPFAALALGALPALSAAGRPGRTMAALALITLVGAIASAVVFPYQVDRPKRLAVRQIDGASGGQISLVSFDGFSAAELGVDASAANGADAGLGQVKVPEGIREAPLPQLVRLPDSLPQQRRVRIEIAPPAADLPETHALTIELPARVAGWSLASPVIQVPPGERIRIAYVGIDEPISLELSIQGEDPVEAIIERHFLAVTPELSRVLESLPPWVTGFGEWLQRTRIEL